MDINIIRYVFVVFTSITVLCGLLSKYIQVYLPLTVTDIHYSKYATATTHNTILMYLINIVVPKK